MARGLAWGLARGDHQSWPELASEGWRGDALFGIFIYFLNMRIVL